jgi:hypothetical protein
LTWAISNDSAWFKAGAQSYRHYCGATVERRGISWTATTKAGVSTPSQRTALDAVLALEKGFSSYWTLAQLESYGVEYGNVRHDIGPVEKDNHLVFTLSLSKGDAFPDFMMSILRKHFYEKAHCSGCSSPMDAVRTLIICEFDGTCRKENIFLTCGCGYPVWRMGMHQYFAARKAMNRSRLIAAEGKHSASEIREILALQQGRCIYCNAGFTDDLRPSKDHLLPLIRRGSNWAMNIVLACRSCNSRRGDIPFRTFCKLLGPAQNGRILMYLSRRLRALDFGGMSREGFDCLSKGLADHDPKHPRYLNIQEMRVEARRNAKRNRLLPNNVRAILKKAVG